MMYFEECLEQWFSNGGPRITGGHLRGGSARDTHLLRKMREIKLTLIISNTSDDWNQISPRNLKMVSYTCTRNAVFL